MSKLSKSDAVRRALCNDILMRATPPLRTWPVRMPPYCYTELCPDERYRPKIDEAVKKRNEGVEENHLSRLRPGMLGQAPAGRVCGNNV